MSEDIMSGGTAATMSLAEAIKTRRSVRGFLDKPVPETIMNEIFELAHQAPSNCNIQPWRVLVASGNTRDGLRDKMVENLKSGVMMQPDYEQLPKFEGVYRKRQVDCAVELYNNMGIARGDHEGRLRAHLRNYELFDAPHVAFIGMERSFGVTVAMDVGMFVQNLMLVMAAYGVGSCAQGCMRHYPDDVRKAFGEPDSTAILMGISFGYEDKSVDANKTIVGRDPLSDNFVLKS